MTESEKDYAIKLANRILDRPYGDPDDDLAVLSRQFLRSLEMPTSEQICELLVRHVESTGSEAFSKQFIKDSKIQCSVWCVIGPNAQEFDDDCEQWMQRHGFNED